METAVGMEETAGAGSSRLHCWGLQQSMHKGHSNLEINPFRGPSRLRSALRSCSEAPESQASKSCSR